MIVWSSIGTMKPLLSVATLAEHSEICVRIILLISVVMMNIE